MTVTEPRPSYRRVRYVNADKLRPGDTVLAFREAPWRVLFVTAADGRVVIVSDSGWVFGCDSTTRFKVQVGGRT